MRVVDRDVEPADAGQRAAGDDDVVERDAAARSARLAAAQDPALERHAAPRCRTRRRRSSASTASSSPASAFDRKPTLPRLMPRIGTSTSATASAARRNVPSPPSTTRTSVVGSSRTRAAVSPDGRLPVVDAAHLAPAGGARAELDGRLDRRVVGEADAGHRHGPVTSAIRSPISAQPGPAARWTRNSRLPSGPVIGEAITRARAEAAPQRRRRRSARGPRDGSPGRGRRHGRSGPRPASNCGLTSATIVAARRRASRRPGRGSASSEMNDTSIDGEADRLGQAGGGQRRGRSSAPSRPPAGRAGAPRRAGRGRRRERRRASRRAAAGRR